MNSPYENGIAGRNYSYFSALCALVTAFTTIAIHQIDVPAGNFEESVILYRNSKYLSLKWIVLFHCLVVLFSMLGVALIIEKRSRALAITGFLFFSLFVFSEWQRTLEELWYINGLRREYVAAANENTKELLRFEIRHRLSASNVSFLLFTIGFSLGNGCYGLAMVMRSGFDRYLGFGLLLWFCCTSCAFIYDFFPAKWLEIIIEVCNKYFQPFIRLVIAYWLFRKAKQVGRN